MRECCVVSNERLRQAIHDAGYEPDDFAVAIDVDPKTVQRWLGGRTPNSRHRARTLQTLNQTLDVTEADIWPELAQPAAGDDSRELIAIYARGDDVRVPDWRVLIRDAQTHIDLLGPTLIDQLTATGTTDLLLEKARAGVSVRIITAHPQSIWTTSLAQQLGHLTRDEHGRNQLDRDIDLTRSYQSRLLAQPHIDVRASWAEHTHTILRFDDDLLVTIAIYGTDAGDAPTLHLRRRGQAGLFDQLLAHFDAIHQTASEPFEALTKTVEEGDPP
jgi:transcriptional regulator with XRE-family HTH domain